MRNMLHKPRLRMPRTQPAACMRRSSAKKPKVRQAVVDVIKEAGAGPETPKAVGALLYATATKVQRRDRDIVHDCRAMLCSCNKLKWPNPKPVLTSCSTRPMLSAIGRRCCATLWTAASRLAEPSTVPSTRSTQRAFSVSAPEGHVHCQG